MNNEMKKLLSEFLFTSVIICCLGLLVSGTLTASQKSAKNTFDKAYTVMNIKSSDKKLEIDMGADSFRINLDITDKIKKYEDYIILTPLASIYYFSDCVTEMIKSRDGLSSAF